MKAQAATGYVTADCPWQQCGETTEMGAEKKKWRRYEEWIRGKEICG